jgi:hypothetical protein
MNSYVLTSERFDGTVKLNYTTKGYLKAWSFEDASMKVSDWKWLLEHLPAKEKNIDFYREQGFRIQLIPPDLSFDAFWKLYNYKVGKNRAERLWIKLSEADKALIIEAVPKYLRHLKKKPHLEQMHASTYLNKKEERWLDQY